MSKVTSDDIRGLATLSSLQLDDSQVSSLQKDIDNILDYIEQLDELDTTGVEPTYQVTGLENVWRTDEVDNSSVDREQLLALAPDRLENQIKVPKVL